MSKKEEVLQKMQSHCHKTLEFWNVNNISLMEAISIMPYLYAELFQNSSIRDLEKARNILDMSKSVTLSMLGCGEDWS